MAFAIEWGDKWNKAILSMTKAKRGLIPELDDVYTGTPALVKSLDTLDKLDPEQYSAPSKVKEKKKALEASQKEFKTFGKEKSKYAKIVDTAIKATNKRDHADVYRDLKVIRTHLDWVENAIENRLTLYTKEYEKMDGKLRDAIEQKTNELYEAGKNSDEVKLETQFLKFAKLLVAFPTAAKTGGSKALAAIQAIKANPTPKTYNDEMDHGGRNYTQQMNNAIALSEHDECPEDLKNLLAGLRPYGPDLAEFGGGDKRTVPLDADKQLILDRTKEYSTLVKSTISYVTVVSNYIKKNKKKLGM